MILINTKFSLVFVLTIQFVTSILEGSVRSEAWKMGTKLRELCAEIIEEFLVHECLSHESF